MFPNCSLARTQTNTQPPNQTSPPLKPAREVTKRAVTKETNGYVIVKSGSSEPIPMSPRTEPDGKHLIPLSSMFFSTSLQRFAFQIVSL
jgi:hypothetical protein